MFLNSSILSLTFIFPEYAVENDAPHCNALLCISIPVPFLCKSLWHKGISDEICTLLESEWDWASLLQAYIPGCEPPDLPLAPHESKYLYRDAEDF